MQGLGQREEGSGGPDHFPIEPSRLEQWWSLAAAENTPPSREGMLSLTALRWAGRPQSLWKNSPVLPGGSGMSAHLSLLWRFFNDTWESIEMQLVFHRRRCGHWETKRHDSNHMEGRGRLRTSWGMTDCCCKQNRDFRVFPEAWVQALLGKLNRWALFSCVSQP